MNKKYITYLRVSTKQQGASGLGLEAQRTMVNNHAKMKRANIIAEYVEVESGKRNNRPKLNEAFTEAKRLGAVLLIAKLDRLSRNASFIFSLRDSGVQFECCDIPEANTLNIGIFATIAQNERELTSERTKKALQAKKEQGFVLGTPKNLTNEARLKGAEANRTKALENQANKMAAAYAATLRSFGQSFSEITKELNKNGFKSPSGMSWNRASVYRLINR